MNNDKMIEKLNQRDGADWYQIVVIVIAALQGFICGALSGWSSPFIVKIVQDKEHYDVTENQAAFFTTLNIVGLVVLTPFFQPCLDIIGRKKAILLTAIPYTISWLIKAVATNLWALYVARLAVGFGDAILMCVTPIYFGEVASPKLRGTWCNSFFILVIFGTFMINVIGIYCSVKVTSYIFLSLQAVFVILAFFIPETPYFYIAKGKENEARACLKKLRQTNNIDEEFKTMQEDLKRQLSESGTWRDLLLVRVNRKALFIAMFLRAAQILSGLWVFGSYTQFIFEKVGSNISSETSTIIFTGLNFLIYSFAVYGSNKLGRRKALMLSLGGTGTVFLFVGTYFLVERLYPDIDLKSISWIPLVGLILFLLVSSFGIGPIPVLMQGELFSASVKSKGVSLVVVFFGFFHFGTNSVFYYFYTFAGLCGPFLLFMVCNFTSLVVSYYIIPETKGKTLEEIQQYLRKM